MSPSFFQTKFGCPCYRLFESPLMTSYFKLKSPICEKCSSFYPFSHFFINMKDQQVFDSNALLHAFTSLLSSSLENGTEINISSVSNVKLASFFGPSAVGITCEEFWCPSLHLRGHLSGSEHLNASLVDIAALNYSIPLKVDMSTLQTVPQRLLCNVMVSFNQLLSSRLRNSTLVLLKKAVKVADQIKVKTLDNLLIKRDPINIRSFAISFRVLDVPNEVKMNGRSNSSSLPLVFEVKIDLNILGIEHNIHFKSHGTIAFKIDSKSSLFQSIYITIDTVQFLRTMIDNVKLIVKKTLRRAAKITTSYVQLKNNRDTEKIQNTFQHSLVQTPTFKNEDSTSCYPEHLKSVMKEFRSSSHQITEELESQFEKYPVNLARTLKELASYPCDENEVEMNISGSVSSVVPSLPQVTVQRLNQSSTHQDGDTNKRMSSEHSQNQKSPLRKRVCWSQSFAQV